MLRYDNVSFSVIMDAYSLALLGNTIDFLAELTR